jgi:glucosamine-6-phosphate isomerase
MNIRSYESYEEMSKHASDMIIQQATDKPDSVLVIAGGNTPTKMLEYLVKAYENGEVSFKNCSFLQLDEWVGLGVEDEGSCHRFLDEFLISKIDAKPENLYFFDAKSEDLMSECRRMDQVIVELGGIDVMVLGIGVNGHLGFNEPGVPFDTSSHVINLDSVTTSVGQKYFSDIQTPSKGITLGIKNILEAKKVMLLANGEKKAPIIKQLVTSEAATEVPATALKLHSDAIVLVDDKAGVKLKS